MATKKMVSAAKKSAKIVAMTALIAGQAKAQDAIAQAAVIDMAKEFGGNMITVNGDPFDNYMWDDSIMGYTWDPHKGDCA